MKKNDNKFGIFREDVRDPKIAYALNAKMLVFRSFKMYTYLIPKTIEASQHCPIQKNAHSFLNTFEGATLYASHWTKITKSSTNLEIF